MFKKILIANRAEIAVRIARACRELGIKTVGIFSEADKDAYHLSLTDEHWQIEGSPQLAYLDIPKIIAIAERSKAEAIHPGYGFLAENAEFAQACLDAGLVFIGPKPDVIHKMGKKIEARRLMEKAGVPTVPGTLDSVSDAKVVKELGIKYGYPIVIKATAGGGGRGLRVVKQEGEVESALTGAMREGLSYFKNDQVYVEKYLPHPRHVEIQILADNFGNVVHLFERDCSSQRRHQKLLEESPAPALDDNLRQRMFKAAVTGAASIGYTGAGTIECLVSGSDFYFLEVNTRVQVEHPITEFTTGIDIVKEQILIASGQKLSFTQEQVVQRGHAIECRINAEDPFANFMPKAGTITNYREPRMPWVRVDSACFPGYKVLPYYDSLLAKLVVWGRDRQEAIVRTKLALAEFQIEGVPTTIPFHQVLLDDPKFQSSNIYTTFVENELKQKLLPSKIQTTSINTQPSSNEKEIVRSKARSFEINVDNRLFKVSVAELKESTKESQRLINKTNSTKLNLPNHLSSSASSNEDNHKEGEVRAAMPGLVKEILVKQGDQVELGQKLLIFEAMKMESEIVSSKTGHIASLNVKPGETVEASSILLVVGN